MFIFEYDRYNYGCIHLIDQLLNRQDESFPRISIYYKDSYDLFSPIIGKETHICNLSRTKEAKIYIY